MVGSMLYVCPSDGPRPDGWYVFGEREKQFNQPRGVREVGKTP
jgi:hypothetical protein